MNVLAYSVAAWVTRKQGDQIGRFFANRVNRDFLEVPNYG
jgi:hypothetical protein